MIYDIGLRIRHDYARPAVGGRHVVRVMPLSVAGGQRLVAGTLDITPHPDERIDRVDFFGNRVTEFTCRAAHDTVALTVQAQVERLDGAAFSGPSCGLRDLAAEVARLRDLGAGSPLHFRAPSYRAPLGDAMTAYARGLLHPGMTVAEAVLAVGGTLHRDMRFDPAATTVDTPAAEAFANRSGVCQDFSHVMICCLRGVGIPAAYVSGFLRTTPPPGQARLEGADAMHAWVRAWCGPQLGWLEHDPTNNCLVGQNHVVVAYGRDYSDVAPVKGMVRGSGGQASQQAVDMIPLGE
ncbi:MAG: transglutaminase family protein [Paracoccaceae bacterium]|nr:transglutaminase family protein [Paracoccaceae bacterium]